MDNYKNRGERMIQILQGFLQLVDTLSSIKITISPGSDISLAHICFGLPVLGFVVSLLSPWSRGEDSDDD